MQEIEVAKSVILSYLSKNINAESLADIYNINSGDKELLKKHIDALKNIFERASEELARELGDDEK